MWDYISATYRDRAERILYTIVELVELFNVQNKTLFKGEQGSGRLSHPDIGNCYIKTLDGMCGIMMVHRLEIYSHNVPQFYPLIEWMAQKGNYTYMMMSNTIGDRLTAWKAMGFETLFAFNNRRTHNNVELLIKKVPYDDHTGPL